jgi:hypothetical protein
LTLLPPLEVWIELVQVHPLFAAGAVELDAAGVELDVVDHPVGGLGVTVRSTRSTSIWAEGTGPGGKPKSMSP